MSVTSIVEKVSEPPRSAGSRSRAATRERLLSSGVELFAAKGLHRVTTHDVSHHAGMAAGTFYLHFKDKGELFRKIASEALGDLQQRLEAASDTGDLRDSVPRIAEALVCYAEENRERVRIVFSIDRASNGDSESVDVQDDLLSTLAASIAAGRRQRIASGEMPAQIDPVILSQALVGMWARVIAWWVEDPNRASRETLIRTLTAIQLAGTHPA
jgi:TetR/AcrR family transcriptional repressor of mexAB-oprM operon